MPPITNLCLVTYHPVCSVVPLILLLCIFASPLPHFSVPVVPRWVTCRLLGILVHYGSCSCDSGSGFVALTCSCTATARLQDVAGFCSVLTLLPLTPSLLLVLPLSLPQRSPRLPPSSFLSLFELFSPLLPALHISLFPLSS